MQLNHLLLAQIEREAPATRRVLERVPDGKTNFKPHPKSMEMGYLSQLVATMFGWIATMIEQDSLDLATGSRPPSTDLLAMFDESLRKAKTALANTNDAHLMKPWQLLVAGKVVDEKPRHIMVADTLSHLAHHRAQLGIYLRLNDVAVPSIYGPTADESWG